MGLKRLVLLGIVAFCLVVAPVAAAGADAGVPGAAPTDAGAADSEAPPAGQAADPTLAELRKTAEQVRDLLAGKLDTGVEPSSLFDVDITDENAMRVEAERLRAVVEWADRAEGESTEDAGASTAGAPKAGAPKKPEPKKPEPKAPKKGAPTAVDAGDGGADAGVEPDYDELRELDPERWNARVELDRARLSFYSLGKTKRAQVLDKHAERQKAEAEAVTKQALTAAEQKAEAADDARDRVLEEARLAKTEAARLVKIEHARLLDIEKQQAEYEVTLVKAEAELAKRGETLLKLQREVRELIDDPKKKPADADKLYTRIRDALTQSRNELAEATSAYSSTDSAVPLPGEDRLSSVPDGVDRSAPDKKREEVSKVGATLVARADTFQKERAKHLYAETVALNDDRLELLTHLSVAKRSAVLGFGPVGLDQVLREGRQVTLVLHYHFVATWHWALELAKPGASRGQSALAATLIAVRWVLPIAVFVWWRRRADRTLKALKQSIQDRDGDKMVPSRETLILRRLVQYLHRVRKPLEWLLVLWAVIWFLPSEAKTVLEVQLVRTVFLWTFGGALVVLTIDFLAGQDGDRRHRRSLLQTAHIRLRSLRLIGRVVVVFGLILSLSALLVGKGTTHSWVWSVCWLSAIPVVLIVVRWWQPVTFELLDQKRKKTAVDTWALAQKDGWQSFVAAAVAGTTLLASGAYRVARNWVSTFDLTRKLLAYLFRREISKKAEAQSKNVFTDLPADVRKTLGPLTPSSNMVPSVADGQVDDIIERINAPGGGVFAIVGERGMGKTTMLQRIVKEADDVSLMRCPFGGMEKFAPAFLKAVEADEKAKLEEAASDFDRAGRDEGAIVIDDAHRLVLPMMGGMRSFDRVLSLAKRHSKNVAWVFAFDEVIWRFFERMRGAKPLFDEVIRLKPWEETAIVSLLVERSREAAIDPTFDHLIGDLADDADEIDREDALARTETSYYRLIWDYAAGNPGVALHTWRSSLGIDPDDRPAVKIFGAPEPEALEGLPDSAVFVLRALIQLERASVEDVCRSTGIPAREVEDALRFGIVRGFFLQSGDEYHVTWEWFRAITRFLQRRHLLFRVAE